MKPALLCCVICAFLLSQQAQATPGNLDWASRNRFGQQLLSLKGQILDMIEFQGELILAGDFRINGKYDDLVGYEDGYVWPLTWLPAEWDRNAWITSLLVHDDYLIAAGHIREAERSSVRNIVVVQYGGGEGGLLTLGGGLDRDILAMSHFNGEIAVATYGHRDYDPAILQIWKGTHWERVEIPGWLYSAWPEDLLEHDGKLWVAGAFNEVGPGPGSVIPQGRSVMTWDGANWEWVDGGLAWDDSTSGVFKVNGIGGCYDLALYQDEVYAAGSFSEPARGIEGLARFDGIQWVGLPSTGQTGALVLTSYGLVPVGNFEHRLLDGSRTTQLAAWNGTDWTVLNDILAGSAQPRMLSHAGIFHGGELIVAGDLVGADNRPFPNKISHFDGTRWLSPERDFGVSDEVLALLRDGQDIILGGRFHRAGRLLSPYVVRGRYDGYDFEPMSLGLAEASDDSAVTSVSELIYFQGAIVAAGSFDLDGLDSQNIAHWDGTRWQPLGSGLQKVAQGPAHVDALQIFAGQLVAAGDFDHAGALPVGSIASWDGAQWNAFPDGFGNGIDDEPTVRSLALHETQLMACGNLISSAGTNLGPVARWDGSTWLTELPVGSKEVNHLASFQGQLIGMYGQLGIDADVGLVRIANQSVQPIPLSDQAGRVGSVDDHSVTGDALLLASDRGLLNFDGVQLTTLEPTAISAIESRRFVIFVGGGFHAIGGEDAHNYSYAFADGIVPALSVDLHAEVETERVVLHCTLSLPESVEQLWIERALPGRPWCRVAQRSGPFDEANWTLDDRALTPGVWSYRALAQTTDGEVESESVTIEFGAPSQHLLPTSSTLVGARPNPFRANTALEYILARAGSVRVRIFASDGRRVLDQELGQQSAGYQRWMWDGKDGAGKPVSRGTYSVRIEAPDRHLRARVSLVK